MAVASAGPYASLHLAPDRYYTSTSPLSLLQAGLLLHTYVEKGINYCIAREQVVHYRLQIDKFVFDISTTWSGLMSICCRLVNILQGVTIKGPHFTKCIIVVAVVRNFPAKFSDTVPEIVYHLQH